MAAPTVVSIVRWSPAPINPRFTIIISNKLMKKEVDKE